MAVGEQGNCKLALWRWPKAAGDICVFWFASGKANTLIYTEHPGCEAKIHTNTITLSSHTHTHTHTPHTHTHTHTNKSKYEQRNSKSPSWPKCRKHTLLDTFYKDVFDKIHFTGCIQNSILSHHFPMLNESWMKINK